MYLGPGIPVIRQCLIGMSAVSPTSDESKPVDARFLKAVRPMGLACTFTYRFARAFARFAGALNELP